MLSPRTATFAPTPNRFRSRGLAAVATAGAGCALVSVAQAQIIYSGAKNLSVSPFRNINIDGDGFNDFVFSEKTGLRINPSSTTKIVTTTAGGTGLDKLDTGTFISAASTFSTGTSSVTFAAGDWGTASSTNTGYFGFSFVSGGSTYYGWAQATYKSSATSGSNIGTLIDWAYNSVAGEGIFAGQISSIPEPATTAMLMSVVALGGATWWKKRRRDRAVPAQREAVLTVAAGTDFS